MGKIARSRLSRRNKKGVSEIVSGVILFSMFTVLVFGYFYTTIQDQQVQIKYQLQGNNLQIQQTQERFTVFGIASNGNLAFYVNNSGAAITVEEYWIFNATNDVVLQQESANTLPQALPFNVAQGGSYLFSSTGFKILNSNQQFLIKVLTARGTTAVGIYPSQILTSQSVYSLVADGFGSLGMTFSSFNWYDYVSGPPSQDSDGDYNEMCMSAVQCSGGSWQVDVAHPHSGSLLPSGQNYTNDGCSYCGVMVPIVFSVNITNNDPEQQNIVITSESNLWVIQVCDTGATIQNCPNSNPIYVFYVLNIGANGAIQSTSKGSFAQIVIPYGVTKTIFYGSAYDLMLHKYQEISLSSDDSILPGNNLAYYGEFGVFLLFAGTRISPSTNIVYGQNLPFESTITSDNLAFITQSPTVCQSNTATTFHLEVNNSAFSGAYINKVVINATAFSSLSTSNVPSHWSSSIASGYITWTNPGSNNVINPGASLNFTWSGKSPTVASTTLSFFPSWIYWNTGQVTLQEDATGCYV